MYIAVAGNIGSGKTSFVEMFAERFGWRPYYERIDNPYLNLFYQDMERWSFNMQMAFLHKKTQQVTEIMEALKNDDIIQDRTIFEEAYVFVRNLHNMGLMSSIDFDLYMSFFNMLAKNIREPDLVIYLKASIPTLVSQINKRGREYEMGIEEAYLEGLNNLYDQLVLEFYKGRVLVVDIDNCDFVLQTEMFDEIVAKIQCEIDSCTL